MTENCLGQQDHAGVEHEYLIVRQSRCFGHAVQNESQRLGVALINGTGRLQLVHWSGSPSGHVGGDAIVEFTQLGGQQRPVLAPHFQPAATQHHHLVGTAGRGRANPLPEGLRGFSRLGCEGCPFGRKKQLITRRCSFTAVMANAVLIDISVDIALGSSPAAKANQAEGSTCGKQNSEKPVHVISSLKN